MGLEQTRNAFNADAKSFPDKYRRQAKFSAWYDDPDDSSSHAVPNPFAKWRPSARANTLRSSEDVEGGSPLGVSQTDPGFYRSSSGQLHHGEASGRVASYAVTSPTAYHPEDEIPRTSSPVNYLPEPEQDQDANSGSSGSPAGQESDSTKQGHRKFLSPLSKPGDRHGKASTEPATDALPSSTITQKPDLKSLFTKSEDAQESDDSNGKDGPPRFSTWSQIHATVFNSWINVLFLLVPVGFALNYVNVNAAAVFAINFVAIIPSTRMISFAVEEITFRLGELQGALLSITFRLVIITSP